MVLGLGLYLSLRGNAGIVERLDLAYLALLFAVGIPAIIAVNATEFVLMGRLFGLRFGVRKAVETSVVAGAANLLPLPGGVMTRTAVFMRAGVDGRRGVLANLVFGGFWLSLATTVSGIFLVRADAAFLGCPFQLAGMAGTLALTVLARRLGATWMLLAGVFATRLAGILLESVRYCWGLKALGFPGTLESGAVLSAASALGSAVSLVPAGLGVREVASAALAKAASIDPSGAFLAASLLRIVTLVGLLALAVVLVWFRRGSSK